MLFHEFGDDLVLELDFFAQEGDGSEVGRVGVGGLALKGGGAVLKERLLPGVELSGLKLKLVAKVGDGDLIDQMATKDGDFFGG